MLLDINKIRYENAFLQKYISNEFTNDLFGNFEELIKSVNLTQTFQLVLMIMTDFKECV